MLNPICIKRLSVLYLVNQEILMSQIHKNVKKDARKFKNPNYPIAKVNRRNNRSKRRRHRQRKDHYSYIPLSMPIPIKIRNCINLFSKKNKRHG